MLGLFCVRTSFKSAVGGDTMRGARVFAAILSSDDHLLGGEDFSSNCFHILVIDCNHDEPTIDSD